jgi:hypothetical protein
MIKIKEISVGFPVKKASGLRVRVLPFQTNDKNCSTYYELMEITTTTSEDGEIETNEKKLADGNYMLTEEEYASWGLNNNIVEDAVLNFLQLKREIV